MAQQVIYGVNYVIKISFIAICSVIYASNVVLPVFFASQVHSSVSQHVQIPTINNDRLQALFQNFHA